MNTIRLKKLFYHLRHNYFTMNNLVLAAALLLAVSWALGSVGMMQRNYGLQRDVDAQKRQAEVTELEVATMQYQQNYYKSDEYKDLAAREHLGLVSPGEKVLMLPPNSPTAKREDVPAVMAAATEPQSNLEQWLNFLFGANAGNAQNLPK